MYNVEKHVHTMYENMISMYSTYSYIDMSSEVHKWKCRSFEKNGNGCVKT